MKKALTLIEMLVALTITTLLMVAALRATSAVTRSDKVMQQREDVSSLATGLEKLFAVDIQHADRYMLAADGFVLSVRSSLEKDNFKLRHIPCVVTYKIKRIGSQTWLVRTQHQTNSEYSELVCVGVSRIYLNTAEAAYELGKRTEAMDYVEKVRVRAGCVVARPALNQTISNTYGYPIEASLQYIRDERLRESPARARGCQQAACPLNET